MKTDQSAIPQLDRPIAALCPLFRRHRGSAEHYASSVAFRLGEHHFLLTAAHVLDEEPILAPTKNRPRLSALLGTVVKSDSPNGCRSSDRIDLGAIRLDPASMSDLSDEICFLTLEDIDFSSLPIEDPLAIFGLLGYPSRRTSRTRNSIRVRVAAYKGLRMSPGKYFSVCARDDWHLLISFQRKMAVSKAQPGSHPPKPEGMSGGGAFLFGGSSGAAPEAIKPYLAGIITDYDDGRGVFICTRIRLMIDLICRGFPETLGHLDGWFSTNLSIVHGSLLRAPDYAMRGRT